MNTLKIFDWGLTQQKQEKQEKQLKIPKETSVNKPVTKTSDDMNKKLMDVFWMKNENEVVFEKKPVSIELAQKLWLSSEKIAKIQNETTQKITISNVLEKLEKRYTADDSLQAAA